jgi:DNA polymerase IIIc chi subunit
MHNESAFLMLTKWKKTKILTCDPHQKEKLNKTFWFFNSMVFGLLPL